MVTESRCVPGLHTGDLARNQDDWEHPQSAGEMSPVTEERALQTHRKAVPVAFVLWMVCLVQTNFALAMAS
jgi:hypothetical protein